MRLANFFILTFFFSLCVFDTLAQVRTIVTGRITEAKTGVPIPFANIIFNGTREGGISNFDGYYSVETLLPVDSITVKYIGFVSRTKPLNRYKTQNIDFQLEEDITALSELVIYAGENPAYEVLRRIVKNKKLNDKRELTAYDYEAYTKIEFDIDNLSEQVRQKRSVKEITNIIDTIKHLTGEDGKPIMPVLFSEAISRIYYRSSPELRHERMMRTNVSGLGITDGTLTSQVVGATFQEYNFYRNWLTILNKEFVSPITDAWYLYYDYDLMDSLFLDGVYCYKIDFYPKRPQDLAFKGTMWITKDEYAIKQIDSYVPNTANLNYIEKIKIQQELIKTTAGPWLPLKTRVVVDVAELTKNSAGFLAKFYISTEDIKVNQPKPLEFYQNPVSMEEDVRNTDAAFWESNRHDPLTDAEITMFQMIDTLKRIPMIKRTSDLAIFASTGYHKIGKIDWGPYPVFYGNNNIEGFRIGVGGRTNIALSRAGTLGGYVGYGFGDNRFKYRIYGEKILNRSSWSTLNYEYQRELDQIWLLTENVSQNSLFYSLSRFGNLINPFMFDKHRLSYQKSLFTGFNVFADVKYQAFKPQYDFSFNTTEGRVLSDFEIAEFSLGFRYARDEVFVINDNIRLSLGTIRRPAFNFNYTFAPSDILGSDLSYHRIRFSMQKRQKLALFGVGFLDVGTGMILGDVPYPLLFNPIGNQTPVYANFTYNTMNFFEFSADRYVYLKYRQNFEGFLLNAVPLIQKLNWRFVGNLNMLYGQISQDNIDMVNYPIDVNDQPIVPFVRLNEKPFVEIGYGIENIFKVLRVDAFHRLTYLGQPGISKFQLKFSFQLKL